ncbi:MAG: ABC transporter ATP-binding protein [Proteobacteria bacterium]|nr:ABC transporter ATP-binding protein [Pseudomonadota bacterium]
MSSEAMIRADALAKCYHLYDKPSDRLRQTLWGNRRRYYREFWALRGVSFEVGRGEVLGIIGRNGAGKSTLLQLICRTLTPTAGEIQVTGRVAALLELGAGFNPDFSGRENVFFNAAILGLSQAETEARLEEIIEFSGIRDFIDQPVKTYSSGMYLRLAFSVVTCITPDVLIVDEALSVGDGAFARKSFDRIMALKEAGKTILFCSHSMYQVEALCSRALWLERGEMKMLGDVADVVSAYNSSLKTEPNAGHAAISAGAPRAPAGSGYIVKVSASTDALAGNPLAVISASSNVSVTVKFAIDPALPPPSVALGIADAVGNTIASVSSHNDGVDLRVDADGQGQATVVFPRLPLLKGEYTITAFLACEKAIHVYDLAERSATLLVEQTGLEQGIVTLPHEWRIKE